MSPQDARPVVANAICVFFLSLFFFNVLFEEVRAHDLGISHAFWYFFFSFALGIGLAKRAGGGGFATYYVSARVDTNETKKWSKWPLYKKK